MNVTPLSIYQYKYSLCSGSCNLSNVWITLTTISDCMCNQMFHLTWTFPFHCIHMQFMMHVSPTFTWWQCFVPHRLPILSHDTGDGIPAHCCVAMVTVVGDLWSQFIVVPCPTGIHYVARIKTGFSGFFCGKQKTLYFCRTNTPVNISRFHIITWCRA